MPPFNVSTQEAEAAGSLEFKASLEHREFQDSESYLNLKKKNKQANRTGKPKLLLSEYQTHQKYDV